MRSIIALAISLASTAAFAQAQPPPPGEQALIQKLMEEINSNLNLRAQIVQLQDQLKQLQGKDDKPKAEQPHPEKFDSPKK